MDSIQGKSSTLMKKQNKRRLEKDSGKSKENKLGALTEPRNDGKRLYREVITVEWAASKRKKTIYTENNTEPES